MAVISDLPCALGRSGDMSFTIANVNVEKSEKPPQRIEETFAFDNGVTRELRVLSARKPAWVPEWISSGCRI